MPPEPLALDRVTPATFEAVVGSRFEPDDGDEPYTLVAVRRFAATSGQPRAEPFALDFARPGPVVPQGIVALRHAQLGLVEIFLVPVATAGGAVTYEAVFN